jgi:hypothetical protein
MCESAEEIETLPPIPIIHKPGSSVNRNPIVPQVKNRKAEDRCEAVLADESIVRLRLSGLALRRPRQRVRAGWR